MRKADFWGVNEYGVAINDVVSCLHHSCGSYKNAAGS